MPIFTLCSKSMPSTCSRKPCTKCWRDCSPSPTISRPASSWALIHSSVASALACRRSSPWVFHCGQSLWVSASHAGLGRLPAIEVGNMSLSLGSLIVPSHNGPMTSNKPRIVIIGCGFGGLEAARALGETPLDITLVDKTNHHLFQPLLYQVATAGLSAPAI